MAETETTERFKVIEEREDTQRRVVLSEFKDKTYLHFREFYKDDNGDWQRTKKGCAFNADNAEKILEAIKELRNGTG